jgi:hypothetical protein
MMPTITNRRMNAKEPPPRPIPKRSNANAFVAEANMVSLCGADFSQAA